MKIVKINPYTTIYHLPKTEYEVDFATCKEPKETLSSFYNRQSRKPELLINGGLFVMATGKPIANYRDERIDKAISSGYIYGMGVNDKGEMVTGSCKTNFKDFISGYPCLVSNGKAEKITYAKELDGRHPRTVIGYNDTDYLVMIVDGRTNSAKGATFAELQSWLIGQGAKFAINLDGGGSTRCIYKGTLANKPTENRAVDNVVCFYRRQEEKPSEPIPSPGGGQTLKAKCLKKTAVYTAAGTQESGRYISKNDICTIDKTLTDKLLVRVTYPVTGGTRTAYIKDLANFTQG